MSRPARLRASLGRSLEFVWTYVGEVGRDRLLGLAAETAFFAVLSIFPGLLIIVGLLGLLDTVVGAQLAAGAQDRVVGGLSAVLTDKASGAVSAVQDLFVGGSGGLLTFATLGALVSLSGAFAVAIGALNLAYDTGEQRSWLRRRLLGLLMALGTLVLAALVLAAVVVGPLFGAGAQLADLVGLGAVFAFAWNVLRWPLLVLVLVGWAGALFRFAPNRPVRWRDTVPGAAVTAALWLVSSAGFHFYIVTVAGRNPVISAFGGGAIVMTWVYLLSLALLLGGELNATLSAGRSAEAQITSSAGTTRTEKGSSVT